MKDPGLLENSELKEIVGNISFYAKEVPKECSANTIVDDDFENLFKKPHEGLFVGTDYNKYAQDTIFPDAAFKSSGQRVPYSVLSLSKIKLREPFEVSFEVDTNGYMMLWSDLFGVSGVGRTQEEAMTEFEDLLLQDYNSLKELPAASLSEGAKELLGRYRFFLG